jgi:hypothetical protein
MSVSISTPLSLETLTQHTISDAQDEKGVESVSNHGNSFSIPYTCLPKRRFLVQEKDGVQKVLYVLPVSKDTEESYYYSVVQYPVDSPDVFLLQKKDGIKKVVFVLPVSKEPCYIQSTFLPLARFLYEDVDGVATLISILNNILLA